MGNELELSKIQESGEIVLRRSEAEDDGELTAFYVLTSGFALGTTVSLVTQDAVSFAIIMLGSVFTQYLIDSWRVLRGPKTSDINHYSVLQMESLTGQKAPKTLHSEFKAMRASLAEGEGIEFDPYVMMALPRPEGNNVWAKLHKKGLSFYPKNAELSDKEWDEAFSSPTVEPSKDLS
ncbi:MAG: hypothetical protein H9W81_13665 [Enterococcus sp.]|nr:hypothetical protein [Enterococcus sp.]